MSKSKAKGTAAETSIVNYLKENTFTSATRNPPQGSNDKGDINIPTTPGLVIEVKNCVRLELSEWIKEAKKEKENANALVGVVWHKRKGTTNPGEFYVTMSGEDFLQLLKFWRTAVTYGPKATDTIEE